MAKQDINKLKSWFEIGKYPTQEQFWDWMDSYMHKDDKMEIITHFPELDKVLQQKADVEVMQHHFNNKQNPHQVTKQQVGLGKVNNTADVDKPVSKATQAALDLKADKTALESHHGNTTNPHQVTKQQIGLGNVDNTADIDKPISTQMQLALDAKADKDYINSINIALQASLTKLQSQLIPGMIIAWKGSLDNIPTGWKLCEELKDKFILGAGGDFEVGATGGARKHKLTVQEMPSHAHKTIGKVLTSDDSKSLGVFHSSDAGKSDFAVFDSEKVGGNQEHENMPPYYALAYIEYVGFELITKPENTGQGLSKSASIEAAQEVALV